MPMQVACTLAAGLLHPVPLNIVGTLVSVSCWQLHSTYLSQDSASVVALLLQSAPFKGCVAVEDTLT